MVKNPDDCAVRATPAAHRISDAINRLRKSFAQEGAPPKSGLPDSDISSAQVG
jgi:hypothetical protein